MPSNEKQGKKSKENFEKGGELYSSLTAKFKELHRLNGPTITIEPIPNRAKGFTGRAKLTWCSFVFDLPNLVEVSVMLTRTDRNDEYETWMCRCHSPKEYVQPGEVIGTRLRWVSLRNVCNQIVNHEWIMQILTGELPVDVQHEKEPDGKSQAIERGKALERAGTLR